MSYDHRIAAAWPLRIDASIVKQLQADFRKLTKIYQDVPVEDGGDDQNWARARRVFFDFGQNLEEWVYKVLIQHTGTDKDSPAQRNIRASAWNLIGDLDVITLFPKRGQTPNLEALAKSRDANVRRYQKSFRAFAAALNGLLEDGPLERAPAIERLTIGGVQVVFHSLGREQRKSIDIEPFLRDLGRQVKAIASAGFKRALSGMTVHLRFDQIEHGGEYHYDKDELIMFPLGMAYTHTSSSFTHEVGHRYWYRVMTAQARAHWEEVMSTQQRQVDHEVISLFMEQVYDKFLDEHALLRAVESLPGVDPEQRAKLRYLCSRVPSYTDKPEQVKEHLIKFCLGKMVLIEGITDYGATSPIEAWAEAFQRYIIEGPRALGPWTRSFFERLVDGGKLASARRVLAQYRQAT